MRIVLALLKKEFLQIRRNAFILRLLLLMPILQLCILSQAINFEMKNLSLVLVDLDNSSASQHISKKFQASRYFILNEIIHSQTPALQAMEDNKVDLVVVIPAHFEKELRLGLSPTVSFVADAVNGMKAGLASSYASHIFMDAASELAQARRLPGASPNPNIQTTYSLWYNPIWEYKTLILPGLLAVLVTLVSGLLAALNIVREKEMGTMEQLNVSPIAKWQFIIAKLLPFWVIGLFEITLGLLVIRWVFQIPLQGNLVLLYAFCGIYMVLVLALGLFISNVSRTQSQAMFVTAFFFMLFILTSGVFTPVESMPAWAQTLNKANPIAYFVEVSRRILLKGAAFEHLKSAFFTVASFATLALGLSIWRYKKTNTDA
jgi:ABC-2 type transport system permease protein